MVKFLFEKEKEKKNFVEKMKREGENFPFPFERFVKIKGQEALINEKEIPKRPKYLYSAFWVKVLNSYFAARGAGLIEPNLALLAEKLKIKTCPVCGQVFVGSARKKFCSTQCRKKYHRTQKK